MTFHEIIQWLYVALALGLVFGLGVVVAALPVLAERQRRRDENVDRDLEARRAQLDPVSLEAVIESNLTGGRISPATVQRFIDRGWLDPR